IVSGYSGGLYRSGRKLLVGIGPAQSGCGPGGESMKAGSLVAASIVGGATFLLTTACSREPVSVAANVAPATTVESVPDRNIVSVPNPERFPLAEAVARRESDQIPSNGVVAADVSRTYPVTALSSGRVVEVKARLGDDVEKGQLLL